MIIASSVKGCIFRPYLSGKVVKSCGNHRRGWRFQQTNTNFQLKPTLEFWCFFYFGVDFLRLHFIPLSVPFCTFTIFLSAKPIARSSSGFRLGLFWDAQATAPRRLCNNSWVEVGWIKSTHWSDTVDGRNPAPVDVKNTINCRFLYIPGGTGSQQYHPQTWNGVNFFIPLTIKEKEPGTFWGALLRNFLFDSLCMGSVQA